MALEMYEYIEKTKSDHLTIYDIKNMKPGDKFDVIILLFLKISRG